MSQGFLGEQLGSFRLEQVLGTGAMGVVFRATQETTGRRAAVKIVQGEIAENTKLLDRFIREAEIIKQFRHPNIVRWLATGRFKGTYYFAMEYVEGDTLEKLLQDRGQLPWREAVDLAIQICEALQYAHQQGVVHRDLKPSNLMVTRDGKIKLTDFGIAKDLDRTALTAPGRTLGTAAYMAPEQIRGTPAVSHKTDLYAFGAVLYQMLVGLPPFTGASAVVLMHQHINESPPRPSAKIHEIPKALDDLVVALMAKNPTDRPWDADAACMVLTELRDKDARKESVAMVWPVADSPNADPPRAGAATSTGSNPTPARKRTKTAGRSTAGRAEGGSRIAGALSGVSLETIGLVLALFVVGGLMAYWVWPPSAAYLHRHAVALMESPQRSDWLIAMRDYIEPLDRRFPDHPYREETRAWRDQIALDEAEGRAKLLASPVQTRFSEPNTEGERQFVAFNALASKAEAEGDELTAQRCWSEMSATVNADDPEDRKWFLLANKRANDLAVRIQERRAFVEGQLRKAATAYRMGRTNDAMTIQAMLQERYSHYTDLADLFGPAPQAAEEHSEPEPQPEPETESEPQPEPESESTTEAPAPPSQSDGEVP